MLHPCKNPCIQRRFPHSPPPTDAPPRSTPSPEGKVCRRTDGRGASTAGNPLPGDSPGRAGRQRIDKVSNCQTNRPRMPSFAPKYGLVTGKALLGRFVKYTLTDFPSVSCHSAAVPPFLVPPRRSFHTDGRNFTPAESHASVRRKMETGDCFRTDERLRACGHVGTVVRTRPYEASHRCFRPG